jgi:hypothetical protein
MARVALADNAGASRSPSSQGAASPQTHGAGSPRWQRARLVLDQHQRAVDAAKARQILPVRAELADLLPLHGLRRGSTVVVRGSTTVLLALLAEATAGGSWAAVVGMPDLGLLAAAELGVAIPRLAVIPKPGPDFGDVVAALLDGMDLVAVAAPTGSSRRHRPRPDLARRLSARARHRESILISFGNWPGADLELDCTEATYAGLRSGHGHLVAREITVTVRGRGIATRPTSDRVRLPAAPQPRPAPRTRPNSPVSAPTPPSTPSPTGPTRLIGPIGVVDPTGSVIPTRATGSARATAAGSNGKAALASATGSADPDAVASSARSTSSIGPAGSIGRAGSASFVSPIGSVVSVGSASATGSAGLADPSGLAGRAGLACAPAGSVESVGFSSPADSGDSIGSGGRCGLHVVEVG